MGKEELKAKIDAQLTKDNFLYRKLETISVAIGEEPSKVLRFCRENTDQYGVSITKKAILIALQSRLQEKLEEAEEKIQEAMEGGEEGQEELSNPHLEPLDEKEKIKINWDLILNNIAHVHIVLGRTIRLVPSGSVKIQLEQSVRDMETAYKDGARKAGIKVE